jgi:hypothetical protein
MMSGQWRHYFIVFWVEGEIKWGRNALLTSVENKKDVSFSMS